MAEEKKRKGDEKTTTISDLHSFLSNGLCKDCSDLLYARLQSLSFSSSRAFDGIRIPRDETSLTPSCNHDSSPMISQASSTITRRSVKERLSYSSAVSSSPSNGSSVRSDGGIRKFREEKKDRSVERVSNGHGIEFSSEQHEWNRMCLVKRKKDFALFERIRGREVNVLQGLELHTGVFDASEQEKIVNCVYEIQEMGRRGKLRERTYSEPIKWMRGKGRITIQFGCCYNYATDRNGNPPGIIRDEEVDPLPPMFKMMIKRMIRWNVLPPTCVPNSCIVNIYDVGDCIPPHIDHHDFVRPFCTVSFLSECNIKFGLNIQVAGPGEFDAPTAISLPTGSVFILNGNGADVAKHCVPACPSKRISITFRKMDDRKLPIAFKDDVDLHGIRPLQRPNGQQDIQQVQRSTMNKNRSEAVEVGKEQIMLAPDEYPPLNGLDFNKKQGPRTFIRQ